MSKRSTAKKPVRKKSSVTRSNNDQSVLSALSWNAAWLRSQAPRSGAYAADTGQ